MKDFFFLQLWSNFIIWYDIASLWKYILFVFMNLFKKLS